MEIRYWILTAYTNYAGEENSDYFAGTEDELVEFADEKIYDIAMDYWEMHDDEYPDFDEFMSDCGYSIEEIPKSMYDEYMGY